MCLALATFPVVTSTIANDRSPTTPALSISRLAARSPCIDLTGKRHSSLIAPTTSLVVIPDSFSVPRGGVIIAPNSTARRAGRR